MTDACVIRDILNANGMSTSARHNSVKSKLKDADRISVGYNLLSEDRGKKKQMFVRCTPAILLAFFLLAPVAHAAEADAVLGLWNIPDNEAQFEIYTCGSEYCGRITYMEDPKYPPDDERMPGRPKVDRQNPDPRLRNRPMLGLPLMEGFRYEGDNNWRGRIYNPEDGKTYRCKLSLDGKNRLNVRGYLGIVLLGRTQTWTRPAS
jgi:uncharacterized protein (DUF2147 family)